MFKGKEQGFEAGFVDGWKGKRKIPVRGISYFKHAFSNTYGIEYIEGYKIGYEAGYMERKQSDERHRDKSTSSKRSLNLNGNKSLDDLIKIAKVEMLYQKNTEKIKSFEKGNEG